MSWELALPGWALRVIQIARMRPYRDPRILDIESGGGGGSNIDFYVHVANNGTQRCRCGFSARVGEEIDVECAPVRDDLLANSPATHVRVFVPRPKHGDLVEDFGDEPTLYGETLTFELTFGKKTRSKEWREKVYAPEDGERYELQQRRWRIGRGEETPDDVRAEYFAERLQRLENSDDDGEDYELI